MATVVAVSDLSAKSLSLWSGTANLTPPSGWQTSAFVDSGWPSPAVASVQAGPANPQPVPTTSPVWSTPLPASDTQRVLFRQSFAVAAPSPGAGLLELAIDDLCLGVYINGTLIVGTDSQGYVDPVTYAIPSGVLVTGANHVACEVANSQPVHAWASWRVTVNDAYCEYGTRLQPGQQEVLVITEAVIAAASVLVPELALFAVAFGAFAGWTLVPGAFCAGPPPDMPTFTNSDFLFATGLPSPGSIPKFWQALQSAVWPLYCECLPAVGGAPPPTPFPAPVVTAPPFGAVLPPATIVCDGEDLCTSLETIHRQLLALQSQMTYLRSDVQLIQRQKVPFAYLQGTVHSGLSGSGLFAVSGILGLSVVVDVEPFALGSEAGNPVELFGAGWVNSGSADGWRSSRRVMANPSWIPVEPDDTLVGYSFPSGMVATITELRREP